MSQYESLRPSFRGTGHALLVIQLVNGLLAMVTLGLYSFWGRTRVRRYLWGQTEFAGDRFTYHGTGGELLRGYLLGMLVFGVLYAAFAGGIAVVGQAANPVMAAAMLLLGVAAFAAVIGVAQVGARRYRLSRTSWRGIRFSFRGSIGEYVGIHLPGVLLTFLTLGLYRPFFECKQRRFFAERTWFGNRSFEFSGEGRDIFGPYVVALLLMIPTLGLSWFWYSAQRDRYFWANTHFENARLGSTVTGGALLGLVVTNILLVIVTFGLAMPWAIVRARRFVCDRIVVPGDLDLAAVVQDARRVAATGEGVSEILDMGGIEMGAGF